MSVHITREEIIKKPVEEINKITYEKLFRLLLVVFGMVIGWILCYYFPIVGHYSQFATKIR